MRKRIVCGAIGALGLLAAPAARADVTARPEPGGAFVVESSAGTSQRLRVEEATGNLWRDGELFLHSTGTRNTFVGADAGDPLVQSNSNAAFGWNALTAVATGGYNSAFGAHSLQANTAGNYNSAFGTLSLANGTGSENSAFGAFALTSNLGASANSAFGWNALGTNSTGTRNAAFGSRALDANTTASDNVAFGYDALGLTSTGGANAAIGSYALDANTTGGGNVAIGWSAMSANATGAYNVGIGHEALLYLSSDQRNVALGPQSLYGLGIEISGTPMGTNTGNTAVGSAALAQVVRGSANVAIGDAAGFYLMNGSYNVYIASEGNFSYSDESNTIRIGSNGNHSNAYFGGVWGSAVSGGTSVIVNSDGRLGTVVSSARFKEDVRDLGEASETVQKLRSVSFRYREEIAGPDASLEYGMIAEEVAKVAPELVVYDEAGAPFSVRYHLLTPLLVAEVQRQQKLIDAQSDLIGDLSTRLARLEAASAGSSGEPRR